MKDNVLKNLVVFFLFLCFLTAGLLFPVQVQAQDQKGSVTYASAYSVFYQVGGDPATHVAGAGPLTATTAFEGLVDMGKNLETLPSVAESWKVAPDWTYIDFFIKKGIKFHNGDPLTAEDVKYSFSKHMDKKISACPGCRLQKAYQEC